MITAFQDFNNYLDYKKFYASLDELLNLITVDFLESDENDNLENELLKLSLKEIVQGEFIYTLYYKSYFNDQHYTFSTVKSIFALSKDRLEENKAKLIRDLTNSSNEFLSILGTTLVTPHIHPLKMLLKDKESFKYTLEHLEITRDDTGALIVKDIKNKKLLFNYFDYTSNLYKFNRDLLHRLLITCGYNLLENLNTGKYDLIPLENINVVPIYIGLIELLNDIAEI